MKYMVVESFKPGKADAVYARFEDKGRMLPPGLVYIDSWLSSDRSRCYQLMETEDSSLFKLWTAEWNDLTDFEIVQLVESPTKHHIQQGGQR
jgi:hypothetical protein